MAENTTLFKHNKHFSIQNLVHNVTLPSYINRSADEILKTLLSTSLKKKKKKKNDTFFLYI